MESHSLALQHGFDPGEEQGSSANTEEIHGPLYSQTQSNLAGARLSRTPPSAEQHIRENSESHLSLIRSLNEEMAYTESQVQLDAT